MVERIVGPIKGYYIASYACEMGDLGDQFLGFAKVCVSPPADYWMAQACCKFSSEELASTAEDALENAEFQARMQIANMPAPC